MTRPTRIVAFLALAVIGIIHTAALAQDAEENVVIIEKLPMVLDRPGTTYVMKQDLSCPDSGLLIFADDITVDLGGRVLTYGTGERRNEKVKTYNGLQSGNVGHHGIYAPASPREGKDSPVPIRWNTRRKGIVIRNGTVRHGGDISYSDAVYLTGSTGAEVRDLTIEVSAPDSSAIVGGHQSRIHDCRIIHTGTHVSNRHQQLAVIVSGQDAEIWNCTIEGGPQVGIKALDGSHIHHNDIRQNTTATNGYGVQGYGQKNVHVHHNRIIPTNGPGIHVSEKSVGWRVHHNYVEVRERANREYPKGMDTHGIKLEGCRQAKVYENVVVAVSTKGGSPTPLNFSIQKGSNNEVTGNVFVAKKVTSRERATAIYVVGGDGTGTTITDNVFFTNDRVFECYWTPGRNFTFRNSRFYRLRHEDEITTFYFWNSEPVGDLNFVDCVFGPGLKSDGYKFPKTKERWPADAGYTISWTVAIAVKAKGRPVQGAKVVITDASGKVAAEVRTDAAGKIVRELGQFTVHFDARTREVRKEAFAPYTIHVEATGAAPVIVKLPLEKPAAVSIDVATGKHTVSSAKPKSAPDRNKLIEAAKAAAGPKR